MNNQEKIITSLERKDFLDESSIERLRGRLQRKLRIEANEQKKEMSTLKDELNALQEGILN